VLVIDCVEFILLYQITDIRCLDNDDAVFTQNLADTGDKPIGICNVSQP